MKTTFTSTAFPVASRLLLIFAVVLGQCCLAALPAHALGLSDGMQAHAHAQMDATPDAALHAVQVIGGNHTVAKAPEACGDDAPLMAERTIQFQAAVPVARVVLTVPGDTRAAILPTPPDTLSRHSRDWTQVYLI